MAGTTERAIARFTGERNGHRTARAARGGGGGKGGVGRDGLSEILDLLRKDGEKAGEVTVLMDGVGSGLSGQRGRHGRSARGGGGPRRSRSDSRARRAGGA